MRINSLARKTICAAISVIFSLTSLGVGPYAQAQTVPAGYPMFSGARLAPSQAYMPVLLRGIKVNPDNPFQFDFIVTDKLNNPDALNSPNFSDAPVSPDGELKEESAKLVRYFLASLAIPEKDMWVNLSPDDADRIIPTAFGQTEMGRDLLAQDYLLKQITASLLYPEEETGKTFWDKIHARMGGDYTIPAGMLNKIWIVPEKAVVYEGAPSTGSGQSGVAYVIESRLKVMVEDEYEHERRGGFQTRPNNWTGLKPVPTSYASNAMRDIILPAIEREVNEGAHFAQLRQIYSAFILAAWYKQKLKNSLLSQVYGDSRKTHGVDHKEEGVIDTIYDNYLKLFREGVYDYIKEEYDPVTQDVIPRKYFSGGFSATGFSRTDGAMSVTDSNTALLKSAAMTRADQYVVTANIVQADGAMGESNQAEITKIMEGMNVTRAKAVEILKAANEIDGGTMHEILEGMDAKLAEWDNMASPAMRTLQSSKSESLDKFMSILPPKEDRFVFDSLGNKVNFFISQGNDEINVQMTSFGEKDMLKKIIPISMEELKGKVTYSQLTPSEKASLYYLVDAKISMDQLKKWGKTHTKEVASLQLSNGQTLIRLGEKHYVELDVIFDLLQKHNEGERNIPKHNHPEIERNKEYPFLNILPSSDDLNNFSGEIELIYGPWGMLFWQPSVLFPTKIKRINTGDKVQYEGFDRFLSVKLQVGDFGLNLDFTMYHIIFKKFNSAIKKIIRSGAKITPEQIARLGEEFGLFLYFIPWEQAQGESLEVVRDSAVQDFNQRQAFVDTDAIKAALMRPLDTPLFEWLREFKFWRIQMKLRDIEPSRQDINQALYLSMFRDERMRFASKNFEYAVGEWLAQGEKLNEVINDGNVIYGLEEMISAAMNSQESIEEDIYGSLFLQEVARDLLKEIDRLRKVNERNIRRLKEEDKFHQNSESTEVVEKAEAWFESLLEQYISPNLDVLTKDEDEIRDLIKSGDRDGVMDFIEKIEKMIIAGRDYLALSRAIEDWQRGGMNQQKEIFRSILQSILWTYWTQMLEVLNDRSWFLIAQNRWKLRQYQGDVGEADGTFESLRDNFQQVENLYQELEREDIREATLQMLNNGNATAQTLNAQISMVQSRGELYDRYKAARDDLRDRLDLLGITALRLPADASGEAVREAYAQYRQEMRKTLEIFEEANNPERQTHLMDTEILVLLFKFSYHADLDEGTINEETKITWEALQFEYKAFQAGLKHLENLTREVEMIKTELNLEVLSLQEEDIEEDIEEAHENLYGLVTFGSEDRAGENIAPRPGQMRAVLLAISLRQSLDEQADSIQELINKVGKEFSLDEKNKIEEILNLKREYYREYDFAESNRVTLEWVLREISNDEINGKFKEHLKDWQKWNAKRERLLADFNKAISFINKQNGFRDIHPEEGVWEEITDKEEFLALQDRYVPGIDVMQSVSKIVQNLLSAYSKLNRAVDDSEDFAMRGQQDADSAMFTLDVNTSHLLRFVLYIIKTRSESLSGSNPLPSEEDIDAYLNSTSDISLEQQPELRQLFLNFIQKDWEGKDEPKTFQDLVEKYIPGSSFPSFDDFLRSQIILKQGDLAENQVFATEEERMKQATEDVENDLRQKVLVAKVLNYTAQEDSQRIRLNNFNQIKVFLERKLRGVEKSIQTKLENEKPIRRAEIMGWMKTLSDFLRVAFLSSFGKAEDRQALLFFLQHTFEARLNRMLLTVNEGESPDKFLVHFDKNFLRTEHDSITIYLRKGRFNPLEASLPVYQVEPIINSEVYGESPHPVSWHTRDYIAINSEEVARRYQDLDDKMTYLSDNFTIAYDLPTGSDVLVDSLIASMSQFSIHFNDMRNEPNWERFRNGIIAAEWQRRTFDTFRDITKSEDSRTLENRIILLRKIWRANNRPMSIINSALSNIQDPIRNIVFLHDLISNLPIDGREVVGINFELTGAVSQEDLQQVSFNLLTELLAYYETNINQNEIESMNDAIALAAGLQMERLMGEWREKHAHRIPSELPREQNFQNLAVLNNIQSEWHSIENEENDKTQENLRSRIARVNKLTAHISERRRVYRKFFQRWRDDFNKLSDPEIIDISWQMSVFDELIERNNEVLSEQQQRHIVDIIEKLQVNESLNPNESRFLGRFQRSLGDYDFLLGERNDLLRKLVRRAKELDEEGSEAMTTPEAISMAASDSSAAMVQFPLYEPKTDKEINVYNRRKLAALIAQGIKERKTKLKKDGKLEGDVTVSISEVYGILTQREGYEDLKIGTLEQDYRTFYPNPTRNLFFRHEDITLTPHHFDRKSTRERRERFADFLENLESPLSLTQARQRFNRLPENKDLQITKSQARNDYINKARGSRFSNPVYNHHMITDNHPYESNNTKADVQALEEQVANAKDFHPSFQGFLKDSSKEQLRAFVEAMRPKVKKAITYLRKNGVEVEGQKMASYKSDHLPERFTPKMQPWMEEIIDSPYFQNLESLSAFYQRWLSLVRAAELTDTDKWSVLVKEIKALEDPNFERNEALRQIQEAEPKLVRFLAALLQEEVPVDKVHTIRDLSVEQQIERYQFAIDRHKYLLEGTEFANFKTIFALFQKWNRICKKADYDGRWPALINKVRRQLNPDFGEEKEKIRREEARQQFNRALPYLLSLIKTWADEGIDVSSGTIVQYTKNGMPEEHKKFMLESLNELKGTTLESRTTPSSVFSGLNKLVRDAKIQGVTWGGIVGQARSTSWEMIQQMKEDADAAMSAVTQDVGGIALDSGMMDFDVRGQRSGVSGQADDSVDCLKEPDHEECIQLNFTPAQIQQMRENITGFTPVIINIQPILNLPLFLGINLDDEEKNELVKVSSVNSPFARPQLFNKFFKGKNLYTRLRPAGIFF